MAVRLKLDVNDVLTDAFFTTENKAKFETNLNLLANPVKNVEADLINHELLITFADDSTTSLNLNDLVTDIHVSGASLDGTTNILTLTSEDGGPDVLIDLSVLDSSDDIDTINNRLNDLEYKPVDILSFNHAPSANLYEYNGSAVYDLTFSWSTNKTSDLIDTISLSSPESTPTLVNTDTNYVEPSFSVTGALDGSETSKTWTLIVTDLGTASISPNSDSSSKVIRWVYPFFYGASSSDLSGGAGIENLTKSVSRQGNKTFGIVATNEFIYFAYPSIYGVLTTILDGNGFNVTANFSLTTSNVVPAVSGDTVSYNIYKTNSVTTINQNFQFLF